MGDTRWLAGEEVSEKTYILSKFKLGIGVLNESGTYRIYEEDEFMRNIVFSLKKNFYPYTVYLMLEGRNRGREFERLDGIEYFGVCFSPDKIYDRIICRPYSANQGADFIASYLVYTWRDKDNEEYKISLDEFKTDVNKEAAKLAEGKLAKTNTEEANGVNITTNGKKMKVKCGWAILMPETENYQIVSESTFRIMKDTKSPYIIEDSYPYTVYVIIQGDINGERGKEYDCEMNEFGLSYEKYSYKEIGERLLMRPGTYNGDKPEYAHVCDTMEEIVNQFVFDAQDTVMWFARKGAKKMQEKADKVNEEEEWMNGNDKYKWMDEKEIKRDDFNFSDCLVMMSLAMAGLHVMIEEGKDAKELMAVLKRFMKWTDDIKWEDE